MNSNAIISNHTCTIQNIMDDMNYRKPSYNMNTYLYSLFGNNDTEMSGYITNMIYNSPTKFTLHFYYSKFGSKGGISTFMKYLELLFPNIIMELPHKFIKETDYCMDTINIVKDKTILFIDNIELNDINIKNIHILKNMNVHVILITNEMTNFDISIYQESINMNIVEFPHKFVNRKITSLEDTHIHSSDNQINEKLKMIQTEAKDYLLSFHRKHNSMIPIKKRRFYH